MGTLSRERRLFVATPAREEPLLYRDDGTRRSVSDLSGLIDIGSLRGNAFISNLSADARSALSPLLRTVTLESGAILGLPGEAVESIYFPIRAVISTIAQMIDGNAVEVGLTGPEGFSSLAIAFGSHRTPHTSIVQVPGYGYQARTADFLRVASEHEAVREQMSALAEYSFIAAAQFAACNRVHSIAQRYARWILMAHDRMGVAEFGLTQQFSAQMLGVRRAGVTIVAGRMHDAGLIDYHRGLLTIRDRPAIESRACECYELVNSEFRRLMHYDVHDRAGY